MDHEGTRVIRYENGATFIPVCEICKRFVKAPKTIQVNGLDQIKEPIVDCKKCGPTKMIFQGYYEPFDL